jgi:hypothetical protein
MLWKKLGEVREMRTLFPRGEIRTRLPMLLKFLLFSSGDQKYKK